MSSLQIPDAEVHVVPTILLYEVYASPFVHYIVRFMSSLHMPDGEVYVVSSDSRRWGSCRPFRYYVMTFIPDPSNIIYWGIRQSLQIVNTDVYVSSLRYIRRHIYLPTDDRHFLWHAHPLVIHKIVRIIQFCVTATKIASCNKQTHETKHCNVEAALCHIIKCYSKRRHTANYNNARAVSHVN